MSRFHDGPFIELKDKVKHQGNLSVLISDNLYAKLSLSSKTLVYRTFWISCISFVVSVVLKDNDVSISAYSSLTSKLLRVTDLYLAIKLCWLIYFPLAPWAQGSKKSMQTLFLSLSSLKASFTQPVYACITRWFMILCVTEFTLLVF